MAIRLKNKLNTLPETSEYPYGDIKDRENATPGTSVNRINHADFHQFFARMMAEAIRLAPDGFDYNDVPDNAYDGFQFYEALLRVTRPYKIYVSSMTQTGTNAPVETIHENTLGSAISWGRTSAGVYLGTLNGAFTTGKTWIQVSGINLDGSNAAFVFLNVGSVNQIILRTYLDQTTEIDDILSINPAHIEIRVYK